MNGDEENNRTSQSTGVGALLRASRLRHGHDLREIAEALRIRYVHLLAIEEGRYSDLPGAAYTTGFIRTYAEYLGLDGQEIIRRFRNEGKGVVSPDLSFRTPIQEKRIPGGAILLISLIMALLAYGGWLYVSANGRSLAELVPDIPLKLHRFLKKDTPASTAKEDTFNPGEGSKSQSNTNNTGESEETVPSKEPPLPVVAPVVPVAQIAALPPSPAPVLPLPTLKTNSQLHQGEDTLKSTPEPPPVTVAAEPPPPSPPIPPNAKVYGQASGEVRIVISALSDSWIQISEANGEAISTRVLKKGEIYRVPNNRAGLKLGTGNAGALEITVDGHKVPPIGSSGMVRRDVPLDPDKLKAGTTN